MKLGKYRYYKNQENGKERTYEVVAIALDTVHKEKPAETDDTGKKHMETVVYRALYPCEDLEDQFGLYPHFTRTMESFTATETVEGKQVPRFTYIGD